MLATHMDGGKVNTHHREPGERLAISLPAVPVRSLAAYAVEPGS